MRARRFENVPLRSLLQDQKILEELGQRSSEIAESVRAAGETARRAGLEGASERESPSDSLHRLLSNQEVPEGRFGKMEAIVLTTGRPALLIQGGHWEEPRLIEIKKRLEAAKQTLSRAILKVARIELLNHPNYDYVGTAWMIDEGVMITNRHVASIFARRQDGRIAVRTTPFGEPYQAQVDFNEEYESPDPPFEVPVEEVLYIEEDADFLPDMALIRVKRVDALPDPIELSEAGVQFHENVAVIGYPARDSRNDPFVMQDIFKGIYEVKRLSPGWVSGVREDRFILTHDCTTLGGNSGSVVLSLTSGKAVGLHYAGSYLENNFAVTSETLRKKLADLGGSSVAVVSTAGEEERPPTAAELANRTGYDPTFLGEEVPLPVPGSRLKGEIAPVQDREEDLLLYTHFSIAMHKERRMAVYTACNIDGGKLFNIRRSRDSWSLDPRLSKEFQAGNELYRNNPLDRGHMVRRLDPAWGKDRNEAVVAVKDTFHYTNSTPQHSHLNQRSWLGLEDYILDHAATHDLRVNVFTGPVFGECDREYRGFRIPQEYWKVVTIVNAFTGQLSATGYLLSQADFIADLEFVYGEFKTYQVPISRLEEKTGLTFGELSRSDPLAAVEAVAVRVVEGPEDLVL